MGINGNQFFLAFLVSQRIKKTSILICLLLCAVSYGEDCRQHLKVPSSNYHSVWAQDAPKPSQSAVVTETYWVNVYLGNWGAIDCRPDVHFFNWQGSLQ